MLQNKLENTQDTMIAQVVVRKVDFRSDMSYHPFVYDLLKVLVCEEL